MLICLTEVKNQFQNFDDGFSSICRACQEAANDFSAELILFPEMSFSGYTENFEELYAREKLAVSNLTKLAKELNIGIGFGYFDYDKSVKLGENHYRIVGKDGNILLDYIKRHPFSYCGEDKVYRAGDSLATASFCGVPISCQICYDLRFPGPFYTLAGNTHLMIVPANWPKGRISQFDTLLKARAIENQYYVAGINCTGMQGKIEYPGHSVLVSPKGEECTPSHIHTCDFEFGRLLFYEFDDNVEKAREKFPVRNDRRADDMNAF